MNPFELSAKHASIRKFKNTPIPDEDLRAILGCGLRTSSSGNMQSWSVIKSTDEEQKKRLFEIHGEQPMILQAPLLLTFCADFHRMRRWLKLRGAKDGFNDLSGFLVAAFDAMLAAQSICLAAESKGLGICYMGTTLWCSKELIEEFKLPAGVIPVTTVVMGYPDEAPPPRDRLALDVLVHDGRYRADSDEDILRAYADREVKGWKRYEQHGGPDFIRRLKEAGVENLAQFYTSEFKYSKEAFARTAREYLQSLKDQDYWDF